MATPNNQEFSPAEINAAMQLLALANSGNADAAKRVQENLPAFQAVLPHIQRAMQGTMEAAMLPTPAPQPGAGNRTYQLPAFPRAPNTMTLDEAQAAQAKKTPNPKRDILLSEEKPIPPKEKAMTLEEMAAEGSAWRDEDPETGLRYDTVYMPPIKVTGQPPTPPPPMPGRDAMARGRAERQAEYTPMSAPENASPEQLLGVSLLNFLQEAASGKTPRKRKGK